MAMASRRLGERVRLSDLDPGSGVPYCQERFAELPDWVMDLVLNMGVQPDRWNRLVERGEVLELPFFDGWHRVPREVNWRALPTSVGWPGSARSGVAA